MSTISQRSFSSGEVAPALYARVDTSRYATGLKTLRNQFVMRHGGAANRPGTEFIGEVKDSTKAVRLIPFVFSDTQTYVLEFGDQYMRVIKNGDYVKLTAQNITAITNANPCVVTYSGADTYANADQVYISGITGAIGTYLNGRTFKVAGLNAGANTFQLNYLDGTAVDSTAFGSYTSGGSVEEIYTITTPYLEADLPLIQYAQSADVVTLVHKSYAIRELSRTGDASWTLSSFTQSAGPTNFGYTSGPTIGSSGTTTYYTWTFVGKNGAESAPYSPALGTSITPSTGTPASISWTTDGDGVYDILGINVYKSTYGSGGPFYFMGFYETGGGTSGFDDSGVPVDTSTPLPVARDILASAGNYPGVVGLTQQRRAFASSTNETETAWLSASSDYGNFYKYEPTSDSDAVIFSLAGNRVAEIRHIIDLGSPVVFTNSSEFALQGDGGVLTPFAINPKEYSKNGASTLAPLLIDSTALYVQARGSAVRDLNFDYQVDGYRGNDLTIFAAHLVDGYTIDDWAYQAIPHSVVWAVRGDGTLLSLTYVREQQILGWARHDFDGGLVENVCVVPEGTEDAVYVVVQRTIDDRSVRYIERLTQRRVDDRKDMIFMDSALSYDGRNDTATTMTLSGGTNWTYDETLTLTASASFFTAADVGNKIYLYDSDGNELRLTITAYTSGTVVSATPHQTVDASLRSSAQTTWTRAVDQLTGLWHLEGLDVSILADGAVVASPNNPAYTVVTVTNGTVTLSEARGVIHVGIPYVADLETLDIDTAEGETLSDKKKLVNRLTVHLEESAGLFVGRQEPTGTDLLEGLVELKLRGLEMYGDPTALKTGIATVNIEANWNSNGHVFIRQVDPLPMSILAVSPAGYLPFK